MVGAELRLLRATKKGAAIRTSQQQRFALLFSVLRSPKAQSYFHIDKSRCVKKNFGLIENFDQEFFSWKLWQWIFTKKRWHF